MTTEEEHDRPGKTVGDCPMAAGSMHQDVDGCGGCDYCGKEIEEE